MPAPSLPPPPPLTFARYLRHMCGRRHAAQAWNPHALADGIKVFVYGLVGIVAVGALLCWIAYLGFPSDARTSTGLPLMMAAWTAAALGGPAIGMPTFPLYLTVLVLAPYVLAQRRLQRRRPVAGLWPLVPRVGLPAFALATSLTVADGVGGLLTGVDVAILAWLHALLILVLAGLLGRHWGVDRASALVFRGHFPALGAARDAVAAACAHLVVFAAVCTVGTLAYRIVMRPDAANLFLLTQPLYGAQDTSFVFTLAHLGGVATPPEVVTALSRLHLYTPYALVSTSPMVFSPHVYPTALWGFVALVATLFVVGARFGLQRGGTIRADWSAWWHLPAAYAAVHTAVVAAGVRWSVSAPGGSWTISLALWAPLSFAVCGVMVFVIAKVCTYSVASSLSPRAVHALAGHNLSRYWGGAVERWRRDEERTEQERWGRT
ncbi:hypothetical protein JT358_06975 [Micrococcales bacterium 31B]|nr:hypothetical protein [Micrococcales bacterium 31B]